MKDIAALHRAEYDSNPDIIVSAPGSIKLLGEHTDHSEGLVLASASSFSMQVAVSGRKDTSLRFFAVDLNERKRTTLSNLKYKREDRWANYMKGVLYAFFELGCQPRGFNCTVSGDIPTGVGFASSAAIEIATAIALKGIYGVSLADMYLIETARKAETEFIGKPIGLLDHIVSFFGTKNFALMVDLRSLKYKSLPFGSDAYEMIITDSRVPRLSVDAELKQRFSDCKKCLAALNQKRAGKSLRDFSNSDLADSMGLLPESVRRRSLFIVEEIRRVIEAEEVLRKNDLSSFGKIVNRSHEGLRDLYEVSCPEIDWLVKRALEIEGVLCSRMTGKGFGGCTVTLIKPDALPEYRKRLEEYERIFGFRPVVYPVSVSDGASVVD